MSVVRPIVSSPIKKYTSKEMPKRLINIHSTAMRKRMEIKPYGTKYFFPLQERGFIFMRQ